MLNLKGSYWHVRIIKVTDWDDASPQIEASLDSWVTPTGAADLPLPRAGDSYWLIPNAEFAEALWGDQLPWGPDHPSYDEMGQ